MTKSNINPVADFIRENYEHKGGNSGFAKDAGVTYQTVHKTILGLYRAIPTKMVEFMAKQSDLNAREWQNEYDLWVTRELDILVTDISRGHLECEALFVPISEVTRRYKDFTEWREALSYSQIDFCKTFLMHQAILQKYEAGDMQSFPNIIRERITYVHKKLHGHDEKLAALYALEVSNLPIRKK